MSGSRGSPCIINRKVVIVCHTVENYKQIPIIYLTVVIILLHSVSEGSEKYKKSSNMGEPKLQIKEPELSIA